jgi:predicted dehydrogenase
MKKLMFVALAFATILSACSGGSQQNENEEQKQENMFTGAENEVKLMTLDPGHFHAALVQKNMYKQVDPTVHVYAPEGPDVQGYLNLINSYNSRSENPTSWEEVVYTGPDYLEKMLEEKPGNVMVTAGNNAKKTEYILNTIEAGINVLADKPMVISPEKFPMLEKAFEKAEENNVLLYDIMTERYEITTILQKEISQLPEVFGTLQKGTPDNPAITKESVHHFFKYVSGSPLKRPAWFFDTEQQGEGIVDVTTHLVDLIQWEAFPEVILSKSDVNVMSAKRWTTDMTPEMFEKVTQLKEFPDYLQKDVEDGILKVYSNGEINYTLKDIHAKVSVIWNFQAPEGAGDTHYSIMRGTQCDLIIKQGEEEGYKPQLYIEANPETDIKAFAGSLYNGVQGLTSKYPGIELEKLNDTTWKLNIPEEFKVGHEAHFGQVTEKYLQFLVDGKLPAWEVPNMIVKYYTTTEGLKTAMQ